MNFKQNSTSTIIFFSPPVRIVHVCVCVRVTLVQLASEVTLD